MLAKREYQNIFADTYIAKRSKINGPDLQMNWWWSYDCLKMMNILC